MAKIRRYENRVIPQAVGTPGVDRSGQILAGGIQQAAEGMYDLGMSQKREAAQEERARAEEALKAQRQVQEVSDAAEFGRASIDVLNASADAQKQSATIEEYQDIMGKGLAEAEKSPEVSPTVKPRLLNYIGEVTRGGSVTMAAEIQKRTTEKALANTDETLGLMQQLGAKMDSPAAISSFFATSEQARGVREVLGPKAYKVLSDNRDAAFEASFMRRMYLDNPYSVVSQLKSGTGLPKDFPVELRTKLLRAGESALVDYGDRTQIEAAASDGGLTARVQSLNAQGKTGDSSQLLYAERKRAEAQEIAAERIGDAATAKTAKKRLAAISGLEAMTIKSGRGVQDDPTIVSGLIQERTDLLNKKGKYSNKTPVEGYVEYLDSLQERAVRQELTPATYSALLKAVTPAAGQAALKRASELSSWFSDYDESPVGKGQEEVQTQIKQSGLRLDDSQKGRVHLEYLQGIAHFKKSYGREPSADEASALGKYSTRKALKLPQEPGYYIYDDGSTFTMTKDGSIVGGIK